MNEFEHGTRARYRQGCQCTPCLRAEAARKRDERRRLKRLEELGTNADMDAVLLRISEQQRRFV